MAKDYLAGIVDLTGDGRINPPTLDFGDGEGSHGRAVSRITSISVHHDASPRPHDYDSVARYVQEAEGDAARLGPGLPYHFRVDNTGVIFRTRPLTTWLNCVGSSENVSTLAICLDGYFHAPVNETPTREQYEALGQLLVNLCEQHPEFPATYPDVRPHRDFSQTACPGDLFAPWVYAVKDKATATAVPAAATYDWPEYQPKVVSVPVSQAGSEPLAPHQLPVVPPAPVSPAPPAKTLPVTPVATDRPTPKVDSLSTLPSEPQLPTQSTTAASWFAGFVAWLKSILGI